MTKTFSIAIGAALALSAWLTPGFAADVGVAISVGDPGYYGRIDIGDVPRPRILYSRPVIVERVRARQEPIHLHVRPGHARHWKRHCHQYNACGQRVYLVNDHGYETVYVDHYRQRRSERRDHDSDRHSDRRDRSDDHDHDHRHDQGNNGRGNDNGRGHGNGKHHD